jgi:predicted small secreted protein
VNRFARPSLLLLAACTSLSSCNKPSQPSLAASTPSPLSACEALILKTPDVAPLLTAPITRSTSLAGDGQSCAFLTTGFSSITVSVRPGLGRASLDAWSNGRMPLSARPLPGVGEAAVWQETLNEIVAQKNDLLCDIQLRGSGEDIAVDAKILPNELGALCNRIFAASQVHSG